MPALFTFVVEYDGGTYISQLQAEDVGAALLLWCDKFADSEDIPKKTRKLSKTVREDIIEHEGEAVLLNGLQNAWCISALRKNKLALINIVKTAE
ncbi:hypothetical protein PQU92_18220 [Asticcacaulis sp. BYS171W]|uniref:Uncharacterized protein n=1 Tax=Asticcacaulis aquaticus TaxID=2984212 RepID=A0ABT5HZ56_9CAUL|nr:hypothetical protein [Asticcacaulis aquaticus]MDC7685223.1 hypothetical protein [Asticcacaulis aquaticus]